MSCDAGYIFDSKTNGCVRGTPRIDHASKKICRKISCDNRPNGYILFPANPAFFAYCSNGTILMYKCPGNEIFDLSANGCVFKCESAGLFPDRLNCTAYYKCEGMIIFKQTKLYCAEGHYFDGMNCVAGTAECGGTDGPTTEGSTEDPSDGSTSTPFLEKSAPILIDDKIVSYSSHLPFKYTWKHKGKYSHRLAKNL